MVDAEENKKEDLLNTLASTLDGLSSRQKNLSETLVGVDKRHQQCLTKLTQEKENVMKMVENKFDIMIRETKDKAEQSYKIQSEMTSLEGNLALLIQMKHYVDNETLTAEDVKNCEENLASIKAQCNSPVKLRQCEYMEFTGNQNKETLVEQLCGELTRKCFTLGEEEIEHAQTYLSVPKFKRKRYITPVTGQTWLIYGFYTVRSFFEIHQQLHQTSKELHFTPLNSKQNFVDELL